MTKALLSSHEIDGAVHPGLVSLEDKDFASLW
jgi:hypothetical protein